MDSNSPNTTNKYETKHTTAIRTNKSNKPPNQFQKNIQPTSLEARTSKPVTPNNTMDASSHRRKEKITYVLQCPDK